LNVRDVCGDSVQDRVGRRAWSRPRVAVSDRLYKQYRVPDPWDPSAKKESTPIGLGPVSLRLGEKRRQPAPHLKPKPPKEKKKSLADVARAAPRPPPKPKPKPSPVDTKAKARAAAADASMMAAKQAEEEARAQKIAERMRQAEAARGKWVRASKEPEESAEPKDIKLPVRPDADEVTLARRNAPVETPRPRPTAQSSRSDGGRFRMQSRKVTAAPVVTRLEPSSTDEVPSPDESSAPPVVPPPRTRTMPSAASGSMDDMFAAAAQMGRLSLRNTEKDTPAEPEE